MLVLNQDIYPRKTMARITDNLTLLNLDSQNKDPRDGPHKEPNII